MTKYHLNISDDFCDSSYSNKASNVQELEEQMEIAFATRYGMDNGEATCILSTIMNEMANRSEITYNTSIFMCEPEIEVKNVAITIYLRDKYKQEQEKYNTIINNVNNQKN